MRRRRRRGGCTARAPAWLRLAWLLGGLCAAARGQACPGISSEEAALLEFRDGLTNAEALADWATGSDTPWAGVVCEAGGEVSELNLYVMGLEGTINWEPLARLSSLRALKLGSNTLSGTLSSTLPPRLEQLSLADNVLSGSIPPGLLLPQTLSSLDLSVNRLGGTLSPAWQLPPAVEELQLANNELAGSLPAGWALPASLRYLSIQNNSLTGALPSWPSQTGLDVRATPQRGPGFCGEIPAAPVYVERTASGWAPLSPLPPCPSPSPPAPALSSQPSPPAPSLPPPTSSVPPPASPVPPTASPVGPPATSPVPPAVSPGPPPAISPVPPAASPVPPAAPPGPPPASPVPQASRPPRSPPSPPQTESPISPPPASVAPGTNATAPSPTPSLPPAPMRGGNATEAAALLTFKGRLSDSKALEDWSRASPAAPCDWAGVAACDEAGHVTQLDLRTWGLAGAVAFDQLSRLSKLQVLRLDKGYLGGSLEGAAFPQTLTELSLAYNGLTSTIPPDLSLPSNLTKLDLSFNHLSGTLPPLVLPQPLRELLVAGNALSGPLPAQWNVSGLTTLDVTGNLLTGSLPSWPSEEEMVVYVLPQNGTYFCGEVPAAPRYLEGGVGVPSSAVANGTLLSCDGDVLPSPAPLPEGDSRSSIGIVVGAVIGGVCALVLALGLGWWCCLRRKKTQCAEHDPIKQAVAGDPEQPPDTPTQAGWLLGTKPGTASPTATQNTGSSGIATPEIASTLRPPSTSDGSAAVPVRLESLDSQAPPTPSTLAHGESVQPSEGSSLSITAKSRRASSGCVSVSPWVLKYSDLRLLKPIGEGAYSKVYMATWRETVVAVKVFQLKDQEDNEGEEGKAGAITASNPLLDHLRKESSLLATLRHPNIVSFLGVCTSPPCLVQEYCQRGSMAQVLERAAGAPNPATALGWPRRLQMLLDAAKGMAYLHLFTPPVVHRDLKTPNLLVDRHWTVKVSDFNLSKLAAPEQGAAKSSQVVNNPRWLAPEILDGGPSSPASDVYAFGVCMWEAATMRLPWGDMTTWQIVNAATSGERPEIPEDPAQLPGGSFDGMPAYLDLMHRCWAQDPAQRPPFNQITQDLRKLLEGFPAAGNS